jgi:hypothetical protein
MPTKGMVKILKEKSIFHLSEGEFYPLEFTKGGSYEG